MARPFFRARTTHRPGANLIGAHAPGAGDNLPNAFTVTATIRVAWIFTIHR